MIYSNGFTCSHLAVSPMLLKNSLPLWLKMLLLEKLVNSGIASVLVPSHFLHLFWVKHWRCYWERNAATLASERTTLVRPQLAGSVLWSASGFGCLGSCFEEDLSHARSHASSDRSNLAVQPWLNYLWCHKNTTLECSRVTFVVDLVLIIIQVVLSIHLNVFLIAT